MEEITITQSDFIFKIIIMKWEDLPIEIQNRMLDEQERQGNERNPDVFKEALYAPHDKGGFRWADSEEGGSFWAEVIAGKTEKTYTANCIDAAYILGVVVGAAQAGGSGIDAVSAEIGRLKELGVSPSDIVDKININQL